MILYFDCFSGISGDMTLGALVDAGVPVEELRKELARIPVKGYELEAEKVKKAGFSATKVNVVVKTGGEGHGARKWKDLKGLVEKSSLKKEIKQQGLKIFKRLFEAEGRVHGERYDHVHLHELGAVDCIVDIFGSLIGLDILGVNTVYSSALNLGSGTIKSAHGILPVPAPASIELLKGVPVYSSDISFELTTPTGAALISSLSSGFGPLPEMEITATGVGAGNRNFESQANVLRLFMGKSAGSIVRPSDSVTVIETNIDDMNPQIYEYVMDMLLKKGALDVFLTNIIMKKGRPGIKLTVLCREDKREALADIIFSETTSIGLRFYNAERKTLERDICKVETGFGKIRVKVSRVGSDKEKVSLEYEDCKKIAKKFKVPLVEVMKTIEG